MPNIPNVSPAAFGVAGQPLTRLSPYALAVIRTPGLIDCWPLDDAGSPARNIKGGQVLGTNVTNVTWRAPTLLRNDPYGYAVRMVLGRMDSASAYTMPAAGSLECISTIANVGGGDTGVGNWNGSGLMFFWPASATFSTIRMYMNGTLSPSYAFLERDFAVFPIHWLMTWDGTTQILYMNGINVLSQLVGSPTAATGINLNDYSSAGHPGTNTFQWLAIYSRVLTPAEATRHAGLATGALTL